jgi:hypothetical protein
MTNLSLAQLRQAVSIKERIDGLQVELNQLLGKSVPTAPAAKAAPVAKAAKAAKAASVVAVTDGRRGRKRSPEMRARMAAAQRARWAKKRKPAAAPVKMAAPTTKAATKAAAPAARKRKRNFSPEAIARISAAAKARWAKARASGKKRLG